MKRITLFIFLSFSTNMFAQKLHSDNSDGTYTNPLISADFPDPDVIQVGDTYYMVSTTMFIFPGVTVLKSHDLVNWEYCSNLFLVLISANVMILIVATGMHMVNGQPV